MKCSHPSGCPAVPVYVLVHPVQRVTLAPGSAADASIAAGAPTADAKIDKVGGTAVVLGAACASHVAEVLAAFEAVVEPVQALTEAELVRARALERA